jgi:hypothetical protein
LQASQEGLENLVRRYVLTDDLSLLTRGATEIKGVDPARNALKLFLGGRHTIETSWDYQKTFRYYREALQVLGDKEPTRAKEQTLYSWLKRTVEGHLRLQEGEAAWTLCNFDRSSGAYGSASGSFMAAKQAISVFGSVDTYSDFRDYSDGWQNIAAGQNHNMLGYLLLRDDRGEDSAQEFAKAEGFLLEAEKSFGRISNALGQHDALTYIVNGHSWQSQKMLYSQVTEACWKDYAFFQADSTFERILSKLDSVHPTYPTEFLTRAGAEALKVFASDIGRLTISRIGGLQLPPVEVKMRFHPEYLVEVEYTLRLPRQIDAFTLYLLKILNTEAVPTYESSFESEVSGLGFKLADSRFRDVSRGILERLAVNAGGDKALLLLDSFAFLRVYSYSPETKVSSLCKGPFNYMGGLFSESETITLQPSGEETKPPDNLFEDMEVAGALATVSQRAAVMVVPEMQEWEVKSYSEVIDHALQSRETVEKMIATMQKEADTLGAKLVVLKDAVAKNALVSQKEIRDLVSSNLDIRLRALRLFDVRQRHGILGQSGIRDVRIFSERVDEKLNVTGLFHRADTLSERIEALYDTAFNLGQDYLSLVIAVNSDISRRAFDVLNVIVLGSLGLSFATAILRTPIGYTLAGLAVFGVSFLGYAYLSYMRRRVRKGWR